MHGPEIYSAIFWGAIVCFVLIGSFFRYKTRESEHRMLEKLAEKGQTISPDLLANIGRDDRSKGGAVKGGIILMFIGIGIGLFFWSMGGGGGLFDSAGHIPNWLPMIGVIPFMIGLGLFVTSFFERKAPK